MRVEIELLGDKQFARQLLRLNDQAQDMKPALLEIEEDFYQHQTQRFNTRGFGEWRPLKPETIARKIAAGLDRRVLHASLRLRRSLTSRGAPGQDRLVTNDELRIGSDVRSETGYPYPLVHKHGTRDGRVPARPPIKLTDDRKRRWVKILQAHLMRGVEG